MIRTLFALAIGFALAAAAHAQQFKLASPDLKPNGTIAAEQVFNGFGCSGKNVSPALVWSGAPKDAKSFALLVHDPDAGRADGSALPAGAVQVRTDFGGPGWGGPCPPAGDRPHRYNFTLHALKVEKLDLPKDAGAALAGNMVNANSMAKATLTGRYGRKK